MGDFMIISHSMYLRVAYLLELSADFAAAADDYYLLLLLTIDGRHGMVKLHCLALLFPAWYQLVMAMVKAMELLRLMNKNSSSNNNRFQPRLF
jgi:hypothetical protein